MVSHGVICMSTILACCDFFSSTKEFKLQQLEHLID